MDAQDGDALEAAYEAHARAHEALAGGALEAAERAARAALAGLADALGDVHPDVGNAWTLLGGVLKRRERLAESAAALERATAIFARDFRGDVDPGDDETLAAIARMRALAEAARVDQERLAGRLVAARARYGSRAVSSAAASRCR